jgi:hypothetical protein
MLRYTVGDYLSIPLYLLAAVSLIGAILCISHRNRGEKFGDQLAQFSAGMFVAWLALIVARLVQLIP